MVDIQSFINPTLAVILWAIGVAIKHTKVFEKILTITIIVRKIRQHFIRKQCNYLCYTCKYKYECNIFKFL